MYEKVSYFKFYESLLKNDKQSLFVILLRPSNVIWLSRIGCAWELFLKDPLGNWIRYICFLWTLIWSSNISSIEGKSSAFKTIHDWDKFSTLISAAFSTAVTTLRIGKNGALLKDSITSVSSPWWKLNECPNKSKSHMRPDESHPFLS